ncbi:hypothetical protein G7046_g6492 [Stylonectria norvegica]|nr:hypothetical protein G7046_g6492 [Stylonectria norvegica]
MKGLEGAKRYTLARHVSDGKPLVDSGLGCQAVRILTFRAASLERPAGHHAPACIAFWTFSPKEKINEKKASLFNDKNNDNNDNNASSGDRLLRGLRSSHLAVFGALERLESIVTCRNEMQRRLVLVVHRRGGWVTPQVPKSVALHQTAQLGYPLAARSALSAEKGCDAPEVHVDFPDLVLALNWHRPGLESPEPQRQSKAVVE